jgi:chemotaxis signal transduction protein/preprotein translocase subunit Sec61beta
MPRRQPKEPSCKVLTFSFDELNLSLRIENIRKVVRLPQIHKTHNTSLGIAMVGEEQVFVLDLHYNLYQREMELTGKNYFVVIQEKSVQYGIPVPQIPILQEVVISALKPTPEEYRDHDPLGVASHVFRIGEQTFFLLQPENLSQALIEKHSLPELLSTSYTGQELPAEAELADSMTDITFFDEDNQTGSSQAPELLLGMGTEDQVEDTMTDINFFDEDEPEIKIEVIEPQSQMLNFFDEDDQVNSPQAPESLLGMGTEDQVEDTMTDINFFDEDEPEIKIEVIEPQSQMLNFFDEDDQVNSPQAPESLLETGTEDQVENTMTDINFFDEQDPAVTINSEVIAIDSSVSSTMDGAVDDATLEFLVNMLGNDAPHDEVSALTMEDSEITPVDNLLGVDSLDVYFFDEEDTESEPSPSLD